MPAPANVQSTKTAPGETASPSSTSSNSAGTWVIACLQNEVPDRLGWIGKNRSDGSEHLVVA